MFPALALSLAMTGPSLPLEVLPDTLAICRLPADAALPGWPAVHLSPAECQRVAHGQSVSTGETPPAGLVKVYGPSGELVAIATAGVNRQLRPERVFLR